MTTRRRRRTKGVDALCRRRERRGPLILTSSASLFFSPSDPPNQGIVRALGERCGGGTSGAAGRCRRLWQIAACDFAGGNSSEENKRLLGKKF